MSVKTTDVGQRVEIARMSCACHYDQDAQKLLGLCGAHQQVFRLGEDAGLRKVHRLLDDLRQFCEKARAQSSDSASRGAYADVQLYIIDVQSRIPPEPTDLS
jgi:hypothetical protein